MRAEWVGVDGFAAASAKDLGASCGGIEVGDGDTGWDGFGTPCGSDSPSWAGRELVGDSEEDGAESTEEGFEELERFESGVWAGRGRGRGEEVLGGSS